MGKISKIYLILGFVLCAGITAVFQNCSQNGFLPINNQTLSSAGTSSGNGSNSNGGGMAGNDTTKFLGLYSPVLDLGTPTTYTIVDHNSSYNISYFFSQGTNVYYRADNGVTGPEIWKYDSIVKTSQVLETIAGPDALKINQFYSGDSVLAFTTYIDTVTFANGQSISPYEDRLYYQSGTTAPVPILQNDPNQGQSLLSVAFIKNTLYFSQISYGANGTAQCASYKFDGVSKVLISNMICGMFQNAVDMGGKVLFIGYTPSATTYLFQLLSFDGATLSVVKSFPTGEVGFGIQYSDSTGVYFADIESNKDCVIYKSDGTANGTQPVYVNAGDNLCFSNTLIITKVGTTLFSLTSGRLVSVNSGGVVTVIKDSGVTDIFGQVGPRLIFANNSTGVVSSSDGTAAGTIDYPGKFGITNFSNGQNPSAVVGTKFYYRLIDFNLGYVLIQIDIANETLTEVDTGVSTPPVAVAGKIYYGVKAPDPVQSFFNTLEGTTFKVTDGTAAGTTAIKTISDQVFGLSSQASGGYFVASDPTSQRKVLWSINAANNTVAPVNSFAFTTGGNPTPSGQFLNLQSARYLGLINGKRLYYLNSYLISIDQLIGVKLDLGPIDLACSNERICQYSTQIVGNNLYYLHVPNPVSNPTPVELWKTDGTVAGTVKVDVSIGAGFVPTSFTLHGSINGKLVLTVGNSTQTSILATDGTAAGTTKIESNGSGVFDSFYPVNNVLYFAYSAPDGTSTPPYFIAKTDGTVAGTTNIVQAANNIGVMVPFGANFIYASYLFSATPPVSQIWFLNVANGTTTKLQESATFSYVIGSNSSGMYGNFQGDIEQGYAVVGNKFYFVVNTNGNPNMAQLWVTDGTVVGTTLVKPMTGNIGNFQVAGAKFFFYLQPDTTKKSYDMYISDGTAAGTTVVVSGITQMQDSLSWGTGITASRFGYPNYFVKNGKAYFPYSDAAHGTELWETDGTLLGTKLSIDLNPGPASSSPGILNPVGAEALITFRSATFDRKLFVMP